MYFEKSGRLVDRSTIRRIFANESDLIKQKDNCDIKRRKQNKSAFLKFDAILKAEIMDAFKRTNVHYEFIKARGQILQNHFMFDDNPEIKNLKFSRNWYRIEG